VKTGSGFIRALSVCLTVGMLTSCDASQSPVGPAGAMPQSVSVGGHSAHARSWMLPEAKSDDLLYLSDRGNNSGLGSDVLVYSYPKAKLVGTLIGFASPAGMCTDGNGNVWISNFDGGTIVEYVHGGTEPISTLKVPSIFPQGCSIDPTSGNLAVVGYGPEKPNVPGRILVYAGATGTPQVYRVRFGETSFCGYDNKGNLFIDGFGYYEKPSFAFGEIPKGGATFKRISLRHSIGYPGPVQWDGKYVAVGADDSNYINRYAIRGDRAVQVGGNIVLDGMYVNAAWIHGSKVIVTDRGNSISQVLLYDYPAGGQPVRTIGNLDEQSGVTVSLAPHK
jgi:hypothetical protein